MATCRSAKFSMEGRKSTGALHAPEEGRKEALLKVDNLDSLHCTVFSLRVICSRCDRSEACRRNGAARLPASPVHWRGRSYTVARCLRLRAGPAHGREPPDMFRSWTKGARSSCCALQRGMHGYASHRVLQSIGAGGGSRELC